MTHSIAFRQIRQHLITLSFQRIDTDIKGGRLVQGLCKRFEFGIIGDTFIQPIGQTGTNLQRQGLQINLSNAVEPGKLTDIEHRTDFFRVHRGDRTLNR